MNEYKELISKLREIEKYGNGQDDRFIGALIDTKTAKDAADALEQLTSYTELCEKECEAAEKYIKKLEKDRDEWKTLGEIANKRAEDYREMRRQRDAAIADLKSCCAYNSDCAFCKHYFSDDAAQFCEEGDSCGNWEWRGVREVIG